MKNKIPIIAAVILGIIVMVAINNHIRNIKEQAASQFKGKPVVTVLKDIDRGGEIAESNLGLTTVPTQYIPQQALTTPAEKRQVIGRKTRVPVRAGQLLLWSDLEIEKRGGLSALVPQGERAFTVNFSAGIKTSLLQLNDRVDIIGIFQDVAGDEPTMARVQVPGMPGSSTGDNSVCVVLLQNVTIMALGDLIGDVYVNPNLAGSEVTFALTLPEAQLLSYASTQGELGMVLRREGDIEVLSREELPRITLEDLEKVTGRLDEERKRRTIQVLKGRNVEEIQIESESGMETFE